MKRNIRITAGILISILFIWLAFRRVNLREIGNILKGADYLYFLIALILSGIGYLIRGLRWQILLKPVKRVEYWNSFKAVTIGFMANGILPVRLGELVRAFVIGYSDNISKSSAFATVVVERMFDLFALLFLFSGFLLFNPFPDRIRRFSAIVAIFGILVLIIVILMIKRPGVFTRMTGFLPGEISAKLNRWILSFIEGLRILRNRKTLILSALLSIILWVYIGLVFFTTMHALAIELPFHAALIVMIIVSLGVMIPSAPGFVGTFHYFAYLGLSLFKIPGNTALSFGILSHLVAFIPVSLLGIISLQLLGLSWGKVRDNTEVTNPE